MGSRYGGLKQIEPVGPNKEFIIDYLETIGKRLPKNFDISYAFQRMEDVPVSVDLKDRVKPLGTGHAIYCARNHIEGNFAIINADDFYGFSSFKQLSDFLDNDLTNPETYAVVGYKLKNTVTDNGSVKRGVCFVEDGNLVGLDESIIEKEHDNYTRTSLKTGKKEKISGDTFVSMNMLGFPKEFLNRIEEGLKEFLLTSDDLIKEEFLVPDLVGNLLSKNEVQVKLLETHEKWYGVTYKEDKELVVNAVNEMIANNIYNDNLWKNN